MMTVYERIYVKHIDTQFCNDLVQFTYIQSHLVSDELYSELCDIATRTKRAYVLSFTTNNLEPNINSLSLRGATTLQLSFTGAKTPNQP